MMAKPPDPSPRQPKAALVVSSDANWLWQSAFVLQQAIDNDPEARLDYFFVTDFDVKTSDLAHLLDPRVQVVDVSSDLDRLRVHGNDHVPKAAFLRFLALDLLAASYDQVAYVDGDVYLSWGSWTELFGLPEHKRAVAAVLARPIWFNSPKWRYGRKYRKALCDPMGDRYLNSGVLLINSRRYLAEQVSKRALEFFQDHPGLCQQSDQSALNAVLAGDWDELSPSWNWQVSSFNYPLLADLNPRVIHFTGPIKPWNDANGFFRKATEAMIRFLSDRGATEPLARIWPPATQLTPRGAKFQMVWTDDREAKLARIDRYLQRRDFVDTRAGLDIYSAAKSGFGEPMTALIGEA